MHKTTAIQPLRRRSTLQADEVMHAIALVMLRRQMRGKWKWRAAHPG
jgi:hypothetical protein